jgi:uncharacterized protein (TIRG00374 family)
LKKKLTTALRYILILGFGIGLLWLSFRGVNLSATWNEFKSINYGWLGISIFVSVIAFYSRAIRWNLLLHPLNYKPALSNTMNALMVGYLANLAVPRLGEVTRCGTLNRTEKVPFEKLLGTVIVERVLDVICLAVCMVMTTIIEHDRLWGFLYDNILEPAHQKLSNLSQPSGVLIGLVLLLIFVFLILKLLKKKPEGRSGKIQNLLKGILEGIRSVRHINRKGEFLFHTIFIWFCYFLMSYTCFKALPATAGLGWQAGLFVLVVGGMGMSAPVQGGIGTYHLLVSRGLGLYGLIPLHGMAFATLMHTTQTLLVILMGGISILLITFQHPRTTPHENA